MRLGTPTAMEAVALMSAGVFLQSASADEPAGSRADIEDLSLEELVNIKVTSVSKKETRLDQSPAAVSVITQDDIHRSGARNIPEALRMVPGLEVAQINASEWAISSRGFNGQFANKLLVLVDGRSVYTTGFGGVRWDVQDVVLEDLDRIEVIRGPGATLWGANAVNGVINIITKSAKETQGLLVANSLGTEQQPTTSLRYGGQLGTNLYYRVYVKYENDVGFESVAGQDGLDRWNMLRGGARLDWEPTPENRFTLQGDYYGGDFHEFTTTAILVPPFTNNTQVVNNNHGGNILGRWTHDFTESSQLTLQAYYSHAINMLAPATGMQDMYDLDLQHEFSLGERQDIVWGLGYRYSPDEFSQASFLTWNPPAVAQQIYSGFLQDDLTLIQDRLHLTPGSKFEHNDFTGFEFQPSGRLTWTPSERHTVWAAVSRAVRIPSRFERDAQFDVRAFPTSPAGTPGLVRVIGNPAVDSEKLTAHELGYRIEPTDNLSFDLASFYNVYDDVITFSTGSPTIEVSPGPPHVLIPQVFQNSAHGESYGTEVSATWRATEFWRLMASYTWLQVHLHGDTRGLAGDSPQNQFKLQSYLDFPHHIGFNSALYFVDNVPNQKVSSYLRLDLGLTWRANKHLEMGIWGQNLVDDGHAEFGSARYPVLTEIPRSVYGKVTVRF